MSKNESGGGAVPKVLRDAIARRKLSPSDIPIAGLQRQNEEHYFHTLSRLRNSSSSRDVFCSTQG